MTFRRAILMAGLLLLLSAAAAETFLIASDLHLTGGEETPALRALRAAEGDALILLGDNTNNSREAEHAQMLEFLEALERPAYVIPGNHDMTQRSAPDFIRMYGNSALFGLEHLSYFIFNIFSTMNGAFLNNQYAFKDIIGKSGSDLYGYICNVAKDY